MRTSSQLIEERRAALRAFSRSRDAPVAVEPGNGAAREARMEQERRQAVVEREQEWLHACADALGGERPVAGAEPGCPHAVVVHRAAWIRDALSRELELVGIVVVQLAADGAAGLGGVVAEQPDLVVVQEQLPWKDGLQLVREVRRFAPSARIAVHLDRPAAEQGARDAGADAVFPRATRPAAMAGALAALVGAPPTGLAPAPLVPLG